MIMVFKLSHEAVTLLAGITVILFTSSDSSTFSEESSGPLNDIYIYPNEAGVDSNDFQESIAIGNAPISRSATENISIKSSSDDSTLPNINPLEVQQNEANVRCDPLQTSANMKLLPDILSVDIFSEPDLLQHLYTKIMRIGLTRNNIQYIKEEVNYALERKLLSSCYIPYANLLSSFSLCWYHLLNANVFLKVIQTRRSQNVEGFKALPQEISSSAEMRDLLSSDIISDPESPLRFFNKLLSMSNDQITNLKMQLKNLVGEWWGLDARDLPFSYWYIWFIRDVFTLLSDESAFDSLKRNVAEMNIMGSDKGPITV
ncbi:uncharacterized protein LOC135847498 [Planococcus citri]|uniref:uncharacterized protein LOC135847498 n=1 Tax=Planococcus citri TaxID=170843 RepID=UPI0031FA2A5C